ncbi:MAG TPA: FtsX-like permease family protein, partial [Anaerolineae bacterium]|nr:FtsX-like permease family protein [Anaerolineae bacterium]
ALDPAVAAQIRAHADVARVLPQNNLAIFVNNVGGSIPFAFRLLGLQEADIPTVLAQSGVTLKAGQVLQPRTNGLLLSEEVAAALHLKIGDTLERSTDQQNYDALISPLNTLVSPLKLVGILSGDVRLGIVSYEFLDSHERYRGRAAYGLLVIARPGREAVVGDWLRQAIDSPRTKTYTLQRSNEDVAMRETSLNIFFAPVIVLITLAVTLVIGTINQIAFARRLSEFGTLHAAGYGRAWLARRLTWETAGLALAGWALGLGLAWGALALLNAVVYAPKGFAFNPIQVTVLPYVLPLPLAVIVFTLFSAMHALARMDAVAIVERGELGMEGERSGRRVKAHVTSRPRPLATTTFYQRHKRRAVLLTGATTLMIVGVALLVFTAAMFSDMMNPLFANLRHMSLVSPNSVELDPTVIAQIRTHPTVERVIPVYPVVPFGLIIPAVNPDYPVVAYSVEAGDMAYLVDLYHLKLAEGRLPRPNSNEIVLSWAQAKDRNLQVGDVIGDRDHPIYQNAPTLPSDHVVSGIFAQAENPAQNTWLSFMSLEFIASYRSDWKTDLALLVVPQAGQKAALDTWLENEIAGNQREVSTFDKNTALFQKWVRSILLTFLLMESVIAVVAAIALAGLNYIFVTQRQSEFGVLNALGFTRRQLVWRVVRETAATTGVALLLSVVLCIASLLCIHFVFYAPLGLGTDLFDASPWPFTLPIPLAVIVASAGTIAWTLSRLDPVSIIERR